MKKLYILRHAKAGQPQRKIKDDHARPLSEKGLDACQLLGEYLREKKADFSLVLCSDAARTKQTAALVIEAFGKDVPIEYNHKLYLAGVDELINQLRDVDDEHQSILLVGHNPGLHQLALSLADEGEPDVLSSMMMKFPTGALATIKLNTDRWFDIRQATGTVTHFTFPKALKKI